MENEGAFEQKLIDQLYGHSLDNSKERFWKLVDMVMSHFVYHKNPEVRAAMQDIAKQAAHERAGAYNKYGATKDMSLRKLCLIPDRLLTAINTLYGGTDYPVTTEEFQHGFWKRYPALRTSDTL